MNKSAKQLTKAVELETFGGLFSGVRANMLRTSSRKKAARAEQVLRKDATGVKPKKEDTLVMRNYRKRQRNIDINQDKGN